MFSPSPFLGLPSLSIIRNIIKQLDDDLFPKKEAPIRKNFDNMHMLVRNFINHSLGAPYKWGIPELEKNYACLIHGPIEGNQDVNNHMLLTIWSYLVLISFSFLECKLLPSKVIYVLYWPIILIDFEMIDTKIN